MADSGHGCGSGAARPASTESTGGVGYTFERKVAVWYLAAMLSGAPRPRLDDRRVIQIAFQRSIDSPVDDLHILAARSDEDAPSLELWIAVRRLAKFIRSDEDSQKLIRALVAAIGMPSTPGRERLLVLCAAAGHNPTSEVAELAHLARSRATDESFRAELGDKGRVRSALRDRFDHLEDLIRDFGPEGHEVSTWDLLRQLHITPVRVQPTDDGDWVALLGELETWARDQTLTGATALRSQMADLVAQYDPDGAEVDRMTLCRDVHSALHSDKRLLAAAWEELRRLEEDARGAVRSVCGDESPVALPRDAARQGLQDALASARVLLVSGESGAGKSAVVCSVLDHLADSEGGEFESVYLNLCDLRSRASDLRAHLGAPLDRILGEMSAPTRLVVIDDADRAAETDATPLSTILRDALKANVAICVVTADTGKPVVEGAFVHLDGESVQTHQVEGLGDDEIETLTSSFPSLQLIASDDRSRELLRRPVVADLLARAGGGGIPLSESDVLDQVWARLIRKNEQADRGVPDSRDQVMRQLAQQLLKEEDPNETYMSLDGEALNGLRRDGILRNSSRTSQPLPVFAHDILRDFAVAKILISEGDPEKILEFNAPRWALPATRLAIQALLRDREQSGATLEQLQSSCELLVASGAGARWADLPIEAALGLPDAGNILAEKWDWLIADGGSGLRQALRLVDHRHTSNGLANLLIAGPIAFLLVERGWADELQTDVEKFLEKWLRALVICRAPSGNRARASLRQLIEYRVELGDQRVQEQAEAEAIRLAKRTPEEIAEEEARSRMWELSFIMAPRPRQRRDLPFELKAESTLKFLMLLGNDLEATGEALLRRVAENDPGRLQGGLEAVLAGESLTQHDYGLLIHLVETYYIDDRQVLDLYPFQNGIRDHVFAGPGAPQAAYWYGPFLALLRGSFPSGVACLNRILNHAARVQMNPRTSIVGDPTPSDSDHTGVEMSIAGEPRQYAGTSSTWLWYRGTSVGPYPCMSALQALEVVCDEILERELLPPARLIEMLLRDCENLAVPAMVFGLMVRHLEHFDRLIDPFLVEPLVWEFEMSRVMQESSGFTTLPPREADDDRRKWTPYNALIPLVLSADQERAQELKDMGTTHFDRAQEQLKASPDALQKLAVAKKQALAFDRDQYEVSQSGDDLLIQQQLDPEVDAALGESNEDLRRGIEAFHLQFRYSERIRRPEPLDVEELISDIATAKALISNPPMSNSSESGGAPAAIAAATLEGYFLDDLPLDTEDLIWAAQLLVAIALDHSEMSRNGPPDPLYFISTYQMGADRSAARGLPILLRPDTQLVLTRLKGEGIDERTIDRAISWLFVNSPNETRNAASRALDSVWRAPCNISGECFHRRALGLVEQSVRHSTSPWDPLYRSGQTRIRRPRWMRLPRRRSSQSIGTRHLIPPNSARRTGPLKGRIPKALSSADNLVVFWLNPALRALGAEAGTPSCVHDQATELLDAVLEGHRRIRRSTEIGENHSRWDALFAARAVLARAATGDPTALQTHIAGFSNHFEGLHECLIALWAAAEESSELAAAARANWPWVIREGLRILTDDVRDEQSSERRDAAALAFCVLLPRTAPDFSFMYREMPGEPIAWTDPESWTAEIDLWVQTAIESTDNTDGTTHTRFSAAEGYGTIDSLIWMLSALPADRQARLGIGWIDQLVASAGQEAAQTASLPDWLREVRPHCQGGEAQAWERIADHLYVHGDWRVSDLAN